MKAPWRLVATLLLVMVVGSIHWLQDQAIRTRASPHSAPAIVAITRASDGLAPLEVNAEAEALVRRAVALAGGLSSVVHSGDDVVVKPNLVWDAPPDQGFTTDPRVVRALVRMAREAGAGQVVIAEGAAQFRNGRDERGATREAFGRCGYDTDGDMLDDETGAPLVDLNDAGGLDQHDPALVSQVSIPNGLIWNSYWMPRALMEADVVIGVPVLKNHYLAGVTLSLKNQIGAAPSDIYHNPGSNMYKGQLSHEPNDLGRHMVDLNLARRLDFVVVDGLRGMTDGPTGGTLADPPMQLVIAGNDAVAVDTIGALVMGYDPATIPYLGQASSVGLGTNDVSRIEVLGERVGQVRRDFPAPYGNPPAQRAESNAPTVHLTAPQSGWLVTTTATLEASAQDDDAVAKVEFYAGSELVGTVAAPPYGVSVDLSRYQGQTVAVRAVAYDRMLNDAQDSISLSLATPGVPGATTFQTTTLAIPTYNYRPSLQLRSSGPYTYYGLDWDHYESNPITAQPYTLLALENDYLRVTLLPELGGRIYQMIYKPTGHNELYQNPVIKPTHWGPAEQGWWLAVGGIEWGLPVDEHGYEWGEPWAWSVVTSTHGVTVTVRDTRSTDRLRAAIDVFLPADRAYVAVGPHLENPTDGDVSFKYWTNAMLAPGAPNTVGPDLRFIFNSAEVAIHSTGDDRHFSCAGWTHTSPDCRVPWPFHDGVDFSRLGNWREWLGFFEYPQAAADFIGVYDTAENEGVARVFPANVARGAKGFGMGRPNSGYQIDPGTWTDDGSAYVEVHGGVAPAFWDWAMLPAGQTLSWHEFWYPVSSIGVFSAATEQAALSLQPSGDNFRLGVYSTSRQSASTLEAWDRATCVSLGRWEFPIDPAQPFSTVLPMNGRTRDEVSIMYLDGAGRTLAAIHPSQCRTIDARVQPLPPFVETAAFTVTWVRPGEAAGAGTFQVQARDGYNGAWTDWLSNTPAISGTFTGEHGHTYFFRARTLSPNQGALGDDEWGQAFTTVLTKPAPVLVTSRKTGVWSVIEILSDTGPVSAEVVSYTLLISNTGNLVAHAIITDRLPAGLEVITPTLMAESGSPPIHDDGTILWSGDVPAGASSRLSYALAPAAIQRRERFTNTVTIEGSVLGPFTRRAVMSYAWPIWLPLAMR